MSNPVRRLKVGIPGLAALLATSTLGWSHDSEPGARGLAGFEVAASSEGEYDWALEPDRERDRERERELRSLLDRPGMADTGFLRTNPLDLAVAVKQGLARRSASDLDHLLAPGHLQTTFVLQPLVDPGDHHLDLLSPLDPWEDSTRPANRLDRLRPHDRTDSMPGLDYQVERNLSGRDQANERDRPLTEVTVISGLSLDLSRSWSAGLSLLWTERDYATNLVADTDRYRCMDESWFLGLWAARDINEQWDTRLGLGWSGNDPDRAMRPEFGVVEEYREFAVTIGTTYRF